MAVYAAAYAEVGVAERLGALGVRAFVEVSTCNRIDVLVRTPPELALERVRQALDVPKAARRPYLFRGDGALEQFARIASSIDSMNPGEDQVMRQVRDAVALARSRGGVEGSLAFAVDAALRIARRVRREVALAPRDTSLFSLARPALESLLAARGGSIQALLIGAGDMARSSATLLRGLGEVRLTVANRTLNRAQRLAERLGVEALPFEAIPEVLPSIDLIVAAVPGPNALSGALLERAPASALLIDLGLPPALDRTWVEQRGSELIDMQRLEGLARERRLALEGRLDEAEALLRSALELELAEWAERSLAPSIQQIHALYQAALAEVLPAPEAQRMARRLAAAPVKGLRALAREHGVDAARTFAAEADFEAPEVGCA